MGNKSIGAAAVILDEERRILLVKHSYGKLNWELPGGKAELSESAEETAKREVLEEIGLDVSIGRLTGVYYGPKSDTHHFVFIATGICGDRIPQPHSREILECGYFSIDELPRPMSNFTCNRIREAL